MKEYFSGEKLYGDDFSPVQIEEWYRQEAEAYASMYGVNTSEENFSHTINIMYGYKYLTKGATIDKALGLGASWGYEFLPLIDRIKELHIVDSSEQTSGRKLGPLVPIYHRAEISGKIDFPDNTFDHINALSTLHHIPNVTFVLNELFRVLKKGGYMLLREPVTTMGDWRSKREGLTVNERGIPPRILDKIIADAGMQIVEKHYYSAMTSFLRRLSGDNPFFSSRFYFTIDKYLSKMLAFNMHYHPVKKRERICPQAVFYVLKK